MTESPYYFNIHNGKDTLSLEFCGNSCYLRWEKPVAVAFENEGSHFGYFDLIPDYNTFRFEINQLIGDKLNTDIFRDEPQFLSTFESLITALGNGKYILSLHAEESNELTIRSASVIGSPGIMELVFGKTQGLVLNEKSAKATFTEEFEGNIYVRDNSTDLYDAFDESDNYLYREMVPLIATKAHADINWESVRYFEKLILKDERPLILLFSACCEHKYQFSDYFLLDGHHKFLAYQNQKIVPKLVVLTRVYNEADFRFLPEPLLGCLNELQKKCVFGNTFFEEPAMKWLSENPESEIHKFLHNGWVRTYHSNGQLKKEAHYRFNRIEGNARIWYIDGNLEYERYYVNGFQNGVQKRYYQSGELWEEIMVNDPYDGIASKRVWYKSGQLKMEAQCYLTIPEIEKMPLKTWFENGQVQKELDGTDRDNYEHKEWNEKGELIAHFVIEKGFKRDLSNIPWAVQRAAANKKKTFTKQNSPRTTEINKRQVIERNPPLHPVPTNKDFDHRVWWVLLVSLALILLTYYLYQVE